jgi:uncharacterized membrane-anchored protein
MAKIILTNGVLNVEESYDQILKKERNGDWIELIEDNQEMKHRYKAMGIEADYRVSININHIQCIKP